MKTIKFLSVLLLSTMAVIATAVERPTMNVIPLENNQALIAIANNKPVKFELSIEAQSGDVVFHKESKAELTGLRQLIDYSQLENGDYTLKLKVNDTYVSTALEVNNKGLNVGESKTRYAPYFTFTNDVLKLSYLNFDQENVKFTIYINDEVIFENKLGSDFTILAGYNLSKLEKGNYQVEITSTSNQFVYNFEK